VGPHPCVTRVGTHPCVPYQLIPGLVALFARISLPAGLNPRALHSKPLSTTGFSYADVVRSPMEGDRFNGANMSVNQRLSGSTGHGSGQGLVLNRGGF
jgi:hypothetical protein